MASSPHEGLAGLMVFFRASVGLGRRIRRGTRNRRVRRRRGRPGTRRVPAWLPRAVLACALLGVAFGPVTETTTGPQAAACQLPACKQAVSAQRWMSPLAGTWAVDRGLAGTFPVSGQAYVAVGGDIAVVATGLTVSAYALSNGIMLWQSALSGFKPGSAIMSVRAWPGVVTAGVVSPTGASRTEVVIEDTTGIALRHYPSALFGGAVEASTAITTVVGPPGVTSYDNGSGRVRWRRPASSGQAWRTDGEALYLTESAGGYLHGAPVTGLRVIDLASGSERVLGSPPASHFTGSLAEVFAGVVVFTSAVGVTAYNVSTGRLLWSKRGVVPEGTDPGQGLAYFTSDTGALLGVNPMNGQVERSVSGAAAPGAAGMYVVRAGVALGLDSGPGGEAWGYSLAAARVTWTVPGLPWPHYFADVSGIGGSAAQWDGVVIIAACERLAAAPQPAISTQAPTPTSTPSPVPNPSTSTPATTSGSHAATGASRKPATPARTVTRVPAGTGGPTATAATPTAAATPTPTATATPTPAATPTATPTPAPPQVCAAPVLVALNV